MPRKKKIIEKKEKGEIIEDGTEKNIEINRSNEKVQEEQKIQEESSLKENDKKKQNSQIKIAVILMISIIAVIIIAPFIYGHFFTKFYYINLEFQKTKLGDLKFYSTRIPIADQSPAEGQLLDRDKKTAEYFINLRADPRKLDNVKVNLSYNNTEQLDFMRANEVYISFDPKMKKCDDNSVALIDLSGFLKEFAGLKIKSAVSDKNASAELKIPYVTCNKSQYITVINIRSGNETKIQKTGGNCYELTYADCEIIQVTEKFNLILIEQYMKYFEEKKSWWNFG
ncbi:MAG: hypothetical protein AABX54_00785 [Nanoarchaeota archaeon]